MATPTHADRPTAEGLIPVGYRFPLARPTFDLPPADDVPESTPEPFGLRFFRPTGRVDDMCPIPYRYDTALQVAVTNDGTNTPLITLPEGADKKTTTGTSDGSVGRGEEFTFDQT